MGLLGTPMAMTDRVSDDDLEALEQLAEILRNGFPLVALLQLVRVYAQSMRKIAEAEVRLFHLFVHEPMIREGVPALEMAEQMEGMAGELMPTRRPADGVHPRALPALLHGAGRRRPHGGRPAAEPQPPRPGARWPSASST